MVASLLRYLLDWNEYDENIAYIISFFGRASSFLSIEFECVSGQQDLKFPKKKLKETERGRRSISPPYREMRATTFRGHSRFKFEGN